MTVAPEVFTARMEQHWTEKLGNIANEPLRRTWYQIAKTLNEHIRNHDDQELATKWSVLQPPTGSGKTQSLILYCSMLADLPKSEHPGILIVTRLIDDCEGIVQQINELAGIETAIAYHSQAQIHITTLCEYPVVVITHKAYENALDYLGGDQGDISQTWCYFHSCPIGTRKLVAIDECIDIVESNQAGLEGLKQTLAAIPNHIQEQYPDEILIIEDIIEVLKRFSGMSKSSEKPIRETMIVDGCNVIKQNNTEIEFDANGKDIRNLINELKIIRFDHQIGKDDLLECSRLRQKHVKRLKSLQHILSSWRYYSGINNDHTLHTARLLVPEGTKGAVVFDATATPNLIYELHQDSHIIAAPGGTRNYKNVTLHVSRGHNVGKSSMKESAVKLCGELISELKPLVPKSSQALIVCHKAVEPHLCKHSPSFNMKTAHWGALDGSNKWKDCDTAVIFGLPYLPETWSANVFMALQRPTSTKWLNCPSTRSFGKHSDIRQALTNGQIIKSVVQAINRIRCRKVIDIDGNCEETHVYILLPNDNLAVELLGSIQVMMPNIKITDWTYTGQRRKPRASNHRSSLAMYIRNLPPNAVVSLSRACSELEISRRTRNRLSIEAGDPTSQLGMALKESNVRIENKRMGSTQRSYLIKE